jgi:hypothetical protein
MLLFNERNNFYRLTNKDLKITLIAVLYPANFCLHNPEKLLQSYET